MCFGWIGDISCYISLKLFRPISTDWLSWCSYQNGPVSRWFDFECGLGPQSYLKDRMTWNHWWWMLMMNVDDEYWWWMLMMNDWWVFWIVNCWWSLDQQGWWMLWIFLLSVATICFWTPEHTLCRRLWPRKYLPKGCRESCKDLKALPASKHHMIHTKQNSHQRDVSNNGHLIF